MAEETSSTNCKTCGEPVSSKYCANCGEKTASRLSFKNFLSDVISDTIELEGPLLYTIQQLILNPGRTALRYVGGNRKVFTKPFGFFLLMIGLNYFLNKWLIDPEELMKYVMDGFMQNMKMVPKQNQAQLKETVEWARKSQDYMKEMNFMLIPFLSFMSWRFFNKSGHNLLENFVLFFYTMGIIMFFSAISVLFNAISLKTIGVTGSIINIINFVFIIWAQVQFHKQVNLNGILKALAAYIVSIILYGGLISLGIYYYTGS